MTMWNDTTTKSETTNPVNGAPKPIEIGDQTVKADAGKPRLSLVPSQAIWEIAAVREYGMKKYGDDPENWHYVEPERLWDACLRHVVAAWDNFTAKDKDSGLMHISHAMTNMAFLVQAIKEWEI